MIYTFALTGLDVNEMLPLITGGAVVVAVVTFAVGVAVTFAVGVGVGVAVVAVVVTLGERDAVTV